MRARPVVRYLACTLLLANCAAITFTLVLAANGSELLGSGIVGLWLLVVSLVGGIVAVRRSDHPIGWLLLLTGSFVSLAMVMQEYAVFALADSQGDQPLGRTAAWLSAWLPLPGFVAFGLVLILFPNGWPSSPRWRVVIAAAVALGTVQTASLALLPGGIDGVQLRDGSVVDNPLGVEAAGRALQAAFEVSGALLVAIALIGVVGRLIAFLRAAGEERQQIKWFIFSIGLVLATFFGNIVSSSTLSEDDVGYHVLAFFVPMLAVLAVPVAMGIAILHHRLYDIDRIINRTLVYGVLTAALAALYGFCVVSLPSLVGRGERPPQLVVAASTLLVAALFQPLRARIQRFIDQRFYRSRYDLVRTAEAFGARLRDEVSLETVTSDLLRVVDDTLQPSHASLWLRGSQRST
jgi:hypothetical protein